MGTTTADRLAEATEAAALAARLQRRLDEGHERVLANAEVLEQATAHLAEEERDVERLRGFTWSGVLARVRATKDDDLRREEAEALDARLTAGHAAQRHAQDVETVTALRERLGALGSTERALAEARDAHEAWLREHDPVRGPRLRELAETDGRLAAEQRALREALDAGRDAEDWLVAVLDKLRGAEGWATWDTFVGGRLLADAMKYDHLREVGDLLENAGHALRSLDAELAGVHHDLVDAAGVDPVDRTFDVWFDNIFSDSVVRRRIEEVGRSTRAALDRVRNVGRRLQTREHEVTVRRTTVGDERVRLLDQ